MLLPTEIPAEVDYLCGILKDPGALSPSIALLSVLAGAYSSPKDSRSWRVRAKHLPEKRPEPVSENAPCSKALANARELLFSVAEDGTEEYRARLVKKFAGIN